MLKKNLNIVGVIYLCFHIFWSTRENSILQHVSWQTGTKYFPLHSLRCQSQWLHESSCSREEIRRYWSFSKHYAWVGLVKSGWIKRVKGKELVEQWDYHRWKDSEGREVLGSKNVNTCLHLHVCATSPHPKYIPMDVTTTGFMIFFAVFNQFLFPPVLQLRSNPWLNFCDNVPSTKCCRQWF